MANNYNLEKVNAIAEDDKEFVAVLVQTLLDELPEDVTMLQQAVEAVDYEQTYQVAHKMKPTIELFGLKHYDTLIEIQNWGKFSQKDKTIDSQLEVFVHSVNKALSEIKNDFNL
ncbi:Hpt domain-containing protein [Aurantibacter sp.]|uniref:Hpt domain-containing protein n=1 Tax=Aurantibacter sp. TaxID=2807103 RepID=UPI0035C7AF2F